MKTYQNYFHQFEQGFFASCSLGILLSSCIGGIAAMAVLENGTSPLQIFQLFLVIVASMSFNGAILSQQPAKVVFNLLLMSVSVNTILAVINFARHFN